MPPGLMAYRMLEELFTLGATLHPSPPSCALVDLALRLREQLPEGVHLKHGSHILDVGES